MTLDDLTPTPASIRPRYVEALCIPYNTPTLAIDLPGYDGEVIAPGTFADFLAHPATWPTIRLTDSHHDDGRRPVGRAVEFYDQPNGLVGVFRLFNTPEGRGAGENIAEETFGGVSVEFYVTNHQRRIGLREVRAARLKALSLVDHPAYPEARILATHRRTPTERAAALPIATKIADTWTRTLHDIEHDQQVLYRAQDQRLRDRLRADALAFEARNAARNHNHDHALRNYFSQPTPKPTARRR